MSAAEEHLEEGQKGNESPPLRSLIAQVSLSPRFFTKMFGYLVRSLCWHCPRGSELAHPDAQVRAAIEPTNGTWQTAQQIYYHLLIGLEKTRKNSYLDSEPSWCCLAMGTIKFASELDPVRSKLEEKYYREPQQIIFKNAKSKE